MKITVIMENTKACEALTCEHGLGFFIETEGKCYICDTGQSAATWDNAAKLGIDISKAEALFLSHGHFDHSGGIITFAGRFDDIPIFMQKSALCEFYHDDRYIGIDRRIACLPSLKLLDGNFEYNENVSVFTWIKGRRLWPQSNIGLTKLTDGVKKQDTFEHEQCLVIREKDKSVLLSGCAHNGILNVLDRYIELYGKAPDVVLSGFHMMKKTEYTAAEKENIIMTAKELSACPTMFYTGHCTGMAAFALMKEIMGEKLEYMSTGKVIYI